MVTEQPVYGSRTASVQASTSAVSSVNGLTGEVNLTLDEIPDGATYKRWSLASFASSVLATVLTGLSTAVSTAILATDTILVALGKLQGQLNARPVDHSSGATTFGIASSTLYGHAKCSTTDPLMDGTASAGTDGALFASYNHRHPTDTSKQDSAIYAFTRDGITTNGWANLISTTLPSGSTTTAAWIFNILQTGSGTGIDQRIGILKIMWRNGSITGSEFISFTGSSTVSFGYTGTLALGSSFKVYAFNSSYPYLKFEVVTNYGGAVLGGVFTATDPSMTDFPTMDIRGESENDARYAQLDTVSGQNIAVNGSNVIGWTASALNIFKLIQSSLGFVSSSGNIVASNGNVSASGDVSGATYTHKHGTFADEDYTARSSTYALNPVAGASTAHYFSMSGSTSQTTSISNGSIADGESFFASYQTRGTGFTGTLTIIYLGIDGGSRSCVISSTRGQATLDLQFVRKGLGYICIGSYYA
jgi:hypothetical protein